MCPSPFHPLSVARIGPNGADKILLVSEQLARYLSRSRVLQTLTRIEQSEAGISWLSSAAHEQNAADVGRLPLQNTASHRLPSTVPEKIM